MLGTLQQPAISENGDNLKSDVVELMINEFLTVFELASKWANEHGTSTLITFFLFFCFKHHLQPEVTIFYV